MLIKNENSNIILCGTDGSRVKIDAAMDFLGKHFKLKIALSAKRDIICYTLCKVAFNNRHIPGDTGPITGIVIKPQGIYVFLH